MKKLLATALLLTAGLSTSAHAGFISGTHVTDGGKTVNLQGLEWMPLTYTAGLSRNQVEAAGGFTDRFGGVWNAGEWRYANRVETALLLQSLWGGTEGWSAKNFDGASWFKATFGLIGYDIGFGDTRIDLSPYNNDFSYFLYGEYSECNANSDACHYGLIAWQGEDVYHPEYSFNGWFANDHGLNAADINAPTFPTFIANEDFASLLVRTVDAHSSTVNNPSAISLFVLGLGALLLRRRKTAA